MFSRTKLWKITSVMAEEKNKVWLLLLRFLRLLECNVYLMYASIDNTINLINIMNFYCFKIYRKYDFKFVFFLFFVLKVSCCTDYLKITIVKSKKIKSRKDPLISYSIVLYRMIRNGIVIIVQFLSTWMFSLEIILHLHCERFFLTIWTMYDCHYQYL